MLTFYGSGIRGPIPVDIGATNLPATVNWIDAMEPTAEDMTFLARVLGVHVPTRDDLVEIESSSRLSQEGETLVMSLPGIVKDAVGFPKGTPIGFVVGKDVVATFRFAQLTSIDSLASRICAKGNLSPGGMGATISFLEIFVDHLADVLERIGSDLDGMSHAIFADQNLTAGQRRPRRADETLRSLLRAIGRNGDLISKVSESLLGVSRIAPFISAKGNDLLLIPDFKARLDTIGQDAHSLHEFQDHLTNKTQFLLDTLLGLANIEQNNVFRVLTVVSVIGIPPTFVASMYGMNFKTIPEYDWTYGYAWGLTIIAISAIGPALWFKLKGWW